MKTKTRIPESANNYAFKQTFPEVNSSNNFNPITITPTAVVKSGVSEEAGKTNSSTLNITRHNSLPKNLYFESQNQKTESNSNNKVKVISQSQQRKISADPH
jgi:hypothetical protein